MTQKYCVVLADVVNSQKIENREEFESRLRRAISVVNRNHREQIQTNFSTIKGVDEFGGVITSISPIVDIQKRFSRILYPEQFRMAAVIDKIDVNKSSERISQMDGPVFARGDAVLWELEQSGFRFSLSGKRPHIDEIVSDSINLLEIIRGTWGETAMNVVSEYERTENQSEVAESIDVSPQTVSYHLGKPNVGLVLEIEQNLSEFMYNYEKETWSI